MFGEEKNICSALYCSACESGERSIQTMQEGNIISRFC